MPILYISRKSKNIKNSHFPWVLCYNTATIRQQYCELFIYQKQPTAFSAVKTCEQMETGSKMCQQISSCITGCVCVSVLTMGNSSRARCETLCVAHALSLSVMPAEGGTILKPVWCIALNSSNIILISFLFVFFNLFICFSCFLPLSLSPPVARRYPVFLGRAHRSYIRQEPLYIETVLKVNRTLYIGAR